MSPCQLNAYAFDRSTPSSTDLGSLSASDLLSGALSYAQLR